MGESALDPALSSLPSAEQYTSPASESSFT